MTQLKHNNVGTNNNVMSHHHLCFLKIFSMYNLVSQMSSKTSRETAADNWTPSDYQGTQPTASNISLPIMHNLHQVTFINIG